MRRPAPVDLAGRGAYRIKMPIYLLSVFTTIAAGATLSSGYLVKRFPGLEPLKRAVASSRAVGTLGAVTAAVGFVKLFAPWNQIIILGDFLPAVAGMLLGGMLLIDRYRVRRQPADDVHDEGSPVTPAADSNCPTCGGSGQVRRKSGGFSVISACPECGAGDDIPKIGDALAQIGDAMAQSRTPLGLAGIGVGVVHYLLVGMPIL